VGIAIGTGTPAEAAEAGSRYSNGVTCLADTDQSVYRLYAVGRATIGAFAHLSVLREGVTALREGYGMGSSQGDVMQMPATFVLDANGVVQLAAYASTIAEFPPEKDIRQALIRT
jgi:peroxiredoxin